MATDVEIPSNEPHTTSYKVPQQKRDKIGNIVQNIIDGSPNVISITVNRMKTGFELEVTVSIMDLALKRGAVLGTVEEFVMGEIAEH